MANLATRSDALFTDPEPRYAVSDQTPAVVAHDHYCFLHGRWYHADADCPDPGKVYVRCPEDEER